MWFTGADRNILDSIYKEVAKKDPLDDTIRELTATCEKLRKQNDYMQGMITMLQQEVVIARQTNAPSTEEIQ